MRATIEVALVVPSASTEAVDPCCGRRFGTVERCRAPVLVVFNIPSSALTGLPRCAEHAKEMRTKLASFLLPGDYSETRIAELTDPARI